MCEDWDGSVALSTLFLFFIYAAKGAVLYFLPLYFYALGFSGLQTGILFGARSLSSIFTKLLWVVLARKITSSWVLKVLLMFMILSMLASKMTLILIPKLLNVTPDTQCDGTIRQTRQTLLNKVFTNTKEATDIAIRSKRMAPPLCKDIPKTLTSSQSRVKHEVNRGNVSHNTLTRAAKGWRYYRGRPRQAMTDFNTSNMWEETKLNATTNINTVAQSKILRAISIRKKRELYLLNGRNERIDLSESLQNLLRNMFLLFIVAILAESIFAAPVEKIASDFLVYYVDENGLRVELSIVHLFSAIGMTISALGTSFALSFFGCPLHLDKLAMIPIYNSHFNTMFMNFFALGFLGLIFVVFVPFTEDIDNISVVRAFKSFKHDRSPKLGMYVVTVFILGMSHSATYIFLLWKLQKFGGKEWVVGGMAASATLSEIFMLFFGKRWIHFFSISHLFGVCIFIQGLRLLYYPFLIVPWSAILVELTFMFTNTLLWICLYNYIEYITPPFRDREAYFVLQTVFWESGCGIGSILSGLLYDFLGDDIMFLLMATVVFVWLSIFILVLKFCGSSTYIGKAAQLQFEGQSVHADKGLGPWENRPTIKTSTLFHLDAVFLSNSSNDIDEEGEYEDETQNGENNTIIPLHVDVSETSLAKNIRQPADSEMCLAPTDSQLAKKVKTMRLVRSAFRIPRASKTASQVFIKNDIAECTKNSD